MELIFPTQIDREEIHSLKKSGTRVSTNKALMIAFIIVYRVKSKLKNINKALRERFYLLYYTVI